MGLKLITAPPSGAAGWPVSVAEVLAACRVGGSENEYDPLLDIVVPAAVNGIEQWCGIALAVQTWRLTLDAFSDTIELPKGPVLSVDAVRHVDLSGTWHDVDPLVWTADLESDPQWVVRNSDAAWPVAMVGVNMVRVDFTCGFSPLPGQLKHAVLGYASHLFDMGLNAGMPDGVREQLWNWRRYG